MATIGGLRAAAGAERQEANRGLGRAVLALACACAAVIAALAVAALFASHRSPLTSDESLYLSEGLNIAKGIGPRYTTHDLVQHRPFLFPAMIALPMKLTGGFGGVYWLTKSIVLLDALLLALLVRRMFGAPAAIAAFALTLSNRFVSAFGTTVYLDSMESLFLLLALLGLWEAHERKSWVLAGAAGGALGLAFLTKEAAALWFPLPALFVLLTAAPAEAPRMLRRMSAFYAAFALTAGWWWVYVWLVTGRVYLWPGGLLSFGGAMAAVAVGLAACAGGYAILALRRPGAARPTLRGLGIAALMAWLAAWTFVMTTTGWPYPKDFQHTIPVYLRDVVAGNAAPWPLFAAAVVAMLVRTRADARYRMLALGFALWLPFAIVVAQLNLALRDLLPMMYLACAAAGVALAELLAWLQRQVEGRLTQAAAAAIVVIGAGYFGAQSLALFDGHRADPPAASSDWNNALVRDTAAWIEANVPPGSSLMSSRIYFSQLYVLTDARYRIAQLPTVEVVPHPGATPYLQARATLFRWEDDQLATRSPEQHWISIDAYAAKYYYTALSQEDLLAQITHRQADYLVVSGEDVAFSTTRYLDYFAAPAFTLVHQETLDGAGATYVFRIDRTKLAERPYATVVPAAVLNSLYRQAHGALSASALLQAINPPGVQMRPADGLAPEIASSLTR